MWAQNTGACLGSVHCLWQIVALGQGHTVMYPPCVFLYSQEVKPSPQEFSLVWISFRKQCGSSCFSKISPSILILFWRESAHDSSVSIHEHLHSSAVNGFPWEYSNEHRGSQWSLHRQCVCPCSVFSLLIRVCFTLFWHRCVGFCFPLQQIYKSNYPLQICEVKKKGKRFTPFFVGLYEC